MFELDGSVHFQKEKIVSNRKTYNKIPCSGKPFKLWSYSKL